MRSLSSSSTHQGIFRKIKHNLSSSCCLGIRVLCPTRWTVKAEALSSILTNFEGTLQHTSLSAAEGQQVAHMTVETLKSIRNDQSFNLFWEKVNHTASELDISEPQLPRHRRRPRRYDG